MGLMKGFCWVFGTYSILLGVSSIIGFTFGTYLGVSSALGTYFGICFGFSSTIGVYLIVCVGVSSTWIASFSLILGSMIY
jgi:hypothetical protein